MPQGALVGSGSCDEAEEAHVGMKSRPGYQELLGTTWAADEGLIGVPRLLWGVSSATLDLWPLYFVVALN